MAWWKTSPPRYRAFAGSSSSPAIPALLTKAKRSMLSRLVASSGFDQITESVVGRIAPELERAEIDRAKRKPTEKLDAYDYFLRGMANFHQQTNETNSEALRLFCKAIELDPGFALPHGLGGICYSRRKTRGWATNNAQELAEAERLARRAVELGRDDAVALYTAGFTLAHVVGDVDAGANLIDAALAIDPNSAGGWYYGGWVKFMLGEPNRPSHIRREACG
jgi:tetratricopeptide (TPR) repeat protein